MAKWIDKQIYYESHGRKKAMSAAKREGQECPRWWKKCERAKQGCGKPYIDSGRGARKGMQENLEYRRTSQAQTQSRLYFVWHDYTYQ